MNKFDWLIVFFFDYLKTSGRVAALSSVAEEVIDGAFVDVGALFARSVHLVTRIADAAVGSQHVFTGAVGAHIRVLSTFVDVYQSDKYVSCKSKDRNRNNDRADVQYPRKVHEKNFTSY